MDSADVDKTAVEQKLSKLKTAAIQDSTMTLADQYRQEGREAGRSEGQLIGKIQLLQDLLGREITPTEALASRSLDELQALHDVLKALLQ